MYPICYRFYQSYYVARIILKLRIYVQRLDLIRLRNRSKLVERSLFAIIDMLLEAKFITLYFIWRMDMIFTKKFQIFLQFFFFIFLYLIFSSYFCFIDLKRQLEHSSLRPDTSSFVLFCRQKIACQTI